MAYPHAKAVAFQRDGLKIHLRLQAHKRCSYAIPLADVQTRGDGVLLPGYLYDIALSVYDLWPVASTA